LIDYLDALIASVKQEPGALEKLELAVSELEESSRPRVMNPNREGNLLIKSELEYEKLMLSLEEAGYQNTRNMTVFGLEAALDKNQQEVQRLKNGTAKQE